MTGSDGYTIAITPNDPDGQRIAVAVSTAPTGAPRIDSILITAGTNGSGVTAGADVDINALVAALGAGTHAARPPAPVNAIPPPPIPAPTPAKTPPAKKTTRSTAARRVPAGSGRREYRKRPGDLAAVANANDWSPSAIADHYGQVQNSEIPYHVVSGWLRRLKQEQEQAAAPR